MTAEQSRKIEELYLEMFDKMMEQQKRRGREEMNVEETIVDTKKPLIVMNKPIQKVEKKNKKKAKVVFDDENEQREGTA